MLTFMSLWMTNRKKVAFLIYTLVYLCKTPRQSAKEHKLGKDEEHKLRAYLGSKHQILITDVTVNYLYFSTHAQAFSSHNKGILGPSITSMTALILMGFFCKNTPS